METETIKGRIKSLRKYKGLTQGAFGKQIGLSDVSISLIESGKNAVTETVFKLICLTFGVREEWLREGKGEPYINEDNEIERLLSIYRSLSQSGKDEVMWFADMVLQREETEPTKSHSTDFPLEPISHAATDLSGFEEEKIAG
jgi:transcriptional regulator with XRE-family HTH domain